MYDLINDSSVENDIEYIDMYIYLKHLELCVTVHDTNEKNNIINLYLLNLPKTCYDWYNLIDELHVTQQNDFNKYNIFVKKNDISNQLNDEIEELVNENAANSNEKTSYDSALRYYKQEIIKLYGVLIYKYVNIYKYNMFDNAYLFNGINNGFIGDILKCMDYVFYEYKKY